MRSVCVTYCCGTNHHPTWLKTTINHFIVISHVLGLTDLHQASLQQQHQQASLPQGFSQNYNEETPGDGEGQRGLARCSPRGDKELGTTWRLKNNNKVAGAGTICLQVQLPVWEDLNHQGQEQVGSLSICISTSAVYWLGMISNPLVYDKDQKELFLFLCVWIF